jgi:proline iminopeptidase
VYDQQKDSPSESIAHRHMLRSLARCRSQQLRAAWRLHSTQAPPSLPTAPPRWGAWRYSAATSTAALVVAAAAGASTVAAAEQAVATPLRTVYPEIEPYQTGTLRVSETHTLYYELCGNPSGKPVVFLHGGPGGGCTPGHRRFFDPAAYKIVLVDQRGAGRSQPHACLDDNTTWHLVDDIETLRKHLGIDRWQVFGGSWGSTLALAYAQSFPDRVTELVLRGIFLLRKKELDWYYEPRNGAEMIYPDEWERFVAAVPESQRRGSLIAAYNRMLTSSDADVRNKAAAAWTRWEMATSSLRIKKEDLDRADNEQFALAFARIENHYFINGGFFKDENQLLDGVHKIRSIPTVIVQGRYDCVCPMRSAYDLHKAWPEAKLVVIQDAGHSANEPGISAALCDATDAFR